MRLGDHLRGLWSNPHEIYCVLNDRSEKWTVVIQETRWAECERKGEVKHDSQASGLGF